MEKRPHYQQEQRTVKNRLRKDPDHVLLLHTNYTSLIHLLDPNTHLHLDYPHLSFYLTPALHLSPHLPLSLHKSSCTMIQYTAIMHTSNNTYSDPVTYTCTTLITLPCPTTSYHPTDFALHRSSCMQLHLHVHIQTPTIFCNTLRSCIQATTPTPIITNYTCTALITLPCPTHRLSSY